MSNLMQHISALLLAVQDSPASEPEIKEQAALLDELVVECIQRRRNPMDQVQVEPDPQMN